MSLSTLQTEPGGYFGIFFFFLLPELPQDLTPLKQFLSEHLSVLWGCRKSLLLSCCSKGPSKVWNIPIMHWPICTKENVIMIRSKPDFFFYLIDLQFHFEGDSDLSLMFSCFTTLLLVARSSTGKHISMLSPNCMAEVSRFLPLSPGSNHTHFKCHAELLRCYTVTVQVWILGYKSPELCRPTKPDPESPAAVCGFVCYRRGGRKTVREGKTQLMSTSHNIQHLSAPGIKLKHLSLHGLFVCFSAANRLSLMINYTTIIMPVKFTVGQRRW